ncbi:hypothetical protein PHYSODRAFT_316091 [Phytophthora sojae]|uniref:Putative nuclease HARBI1 n=1 Tax=Phytophthora sojae (strain P6497) TaxID=1094619 RepID=G4ZLC6_PHYSP|nr:hypothetical protein PHYSODRAFT_316091 [Phytophthora sojae]EGZ15972.1 hypothetical protein PHYSODRAFT_316091 [Phytophthora sojae]|eukprot:XP_009529721.1 hypothetical protein PHYSODRAFT_316091 [Phytophthora sojae]
MPKTSGRQMVIAEVIDLLSLAVLEDELDEDAGGSSPFDDWAECFSVESTIKDHRVFQNNSDHPQVPIWLRLAVTLDRLGTTANGSSLGLGTGTLDVFTARITIALIDMSDEYIKWPSPDERSQTARRMRREGFPGCVGFIDGTTFPFVQKPGVDGQCFCNRKHRYSLNGQVVCDVHRRIIAFYSGWPGSCADSTVYREMALPNYGYKRQFFSEGYRWSSLREPRVQIKIKGDIERVLRWINACVVLHNLLIDIADDWSSSGEESSSSDEDDLEWDDDDTFPFRGRLKAHSLTRGREEGVIQWYRGK